MATQPIDVRPVQFLSSTPKPTVRVAFIAGEGAQAVDHALARLPEEVRSATLEEVTLRPLVEEVVGRCRELLSAPVHSAFLQWCADAVRLATNYESEEEGEERAQTYHESVGRLYSTPFATPQDALAAFWVREVSEGFECTFGILSKMDALEGTPTYLMAQSPVARALQALSEQA